MSAKNLRKFLFRPSLYLLDVFVKIVYLISLLFLPITKYLVTKFLSSCGIEVDGEQKGDPQVKDDRFYCNVLSGAIVGIGEAFTNQYFDCEDVREFFIKLLGSKHIRLLCLHPSIYLREKATRFLYSLDDDLADEVGKSYDKWVSEAQVTDEACKSYSCGKWKNASNLKEAFDAKMEMMGRKLKLKPGMKVLDLGCGEGVLLKYLAQNYQVSGVGVNVSAQMVRKAERSCKGLDVTFKVMDMRKITGKYDRITCLGAIEHLGVNDIKDLFVTIRNCLTDDGIFILEYIAVEHSWFFTFDGLYEKFCGIPLINHFAIDMLSSLQDLFVLEDWQSTSHDHSLSMKAAYEFSRKSEAENKLQGNVYYLRSAQITVALYSALSAVRKYQSYYVVLSKDGLLNSYEAEV